jgi:hypothetical protein
MPDLNGLLKRLHTQKVEFVLVGGFAALMHGGTLLTRDLDICCRFSEDNLRRIQAAVADLHPVHRMRPDLPLELTPEICQSLKNLYLKTDLGSLDCLGEVKGVGDYAKVEKHSVVAELPFGECRVLDLDTLIRAKQAMNRDHDKITVRQLLAIKDRQAGQ